MSEKVKNLADLIRIRGELKTQGKKAVFTNGCFDLIHMGHIYLFKAAKHEGDVLIVAVNDDSSIRKIKGPERPVFVLAERLEVLEAVEAVDYLVTFSEETPIKPISVLLPDVLVKGGDWRPEEVVGGAEVKAAGGKIVIVPYLAGYSSTGIINRILNT